jgi:hypothetical protein
MTVSRKRRDRFAIAFLLIITSVRANASGIGAHIGLGLGSTTVRPLESQVASGGSVSAGASLPAGRTLHLALEFQASAGGDWGYHFPEASRPGGRTLTTVLVGPEFRPATRRGWPFAFLGAGFGRYTLEHAYGVFAPPYDRWFVPPRKLTAFALGAGVGYRATSGPGLLGLSLALRTQLMPHSRQIVASATTMVVGLAY